MKKILLFLLSISSFAQRMPQGSHEILHELQKFQVVGNVMYVAAHPDDENTLFITYLANEKKARTAYIAMTRGDGGQNLIGNEQGENVGLIRTHELLEARKRDGGEQYFTRAVDFGFTKTTDEALTTWGKEKVLHDLVWAIRKFQPDVMVNRFPPDSRAGHGHHSASAVLSSEAFDAAGDPTRFPEQLKYVNIWQPKRLVWNSYSPGFQNSTPEEPTYIKIPLGNFNPLLGASYSEIAAEARSMHRSQGFGSAKTRDQRTDYALHIKGTPAQNDLFDGIDVSWNRIPGGAPIGKAMENVISSFSIFNPAKSVPALLAIYDELDKLPKSVHTEYKKEQLKNCILAAAGIWAEATSTQPFAAQGEKAKIFVQLNSRNLEGVTLEKISFQNIQKDSTLQLSLDLNKSVDIPFDISIPSDFPISQPYWLQKPKEKGFYTVDDPTRIGLPMAPEAVSCTAFLRINTTLIPIHLPVKNKYVEPSIGEIYRYFEIHPPVTVTFQEKVLVFNENKPRSISLLVRSSANAFKGNVSISLPSGWSISPKQIPVSFSKKEEEKLVRFELIPTSKPTQEIRLVAQVTQENGRAFAQAYNTIQYPHIPILHTFPPAEAQAIKLDLKKSGSKIGYIAGAGDEVPAALEQIGYEVTLLKEANFSQSLASFDAIVIGVRAYNTEDWLPNYVDALMNYVEKGGNLVTQYQTNAFYGVPKARKLGPYPFEIGRGRVTNEEAEIKILDGKHPIFTTPNKINANDFSGWVQERGLYFASKWAPEYQTLMSMKDDNEKSTEEGALLYAPYGKGNFVFTGLAFFRQLPAGVPGAYRLFANMLSIPKR